jgi:hypothetical protein
MTLISTLTANGTSNVMSFTGIPSTYTDLIFLISGRGVTAATQTDLFMYFGTTNGTNRTGYNRIGMWPNSTIISAFSGSNDTQWNLQQTIPATNATANTFSNLRVHLMNYATTAVKNVVVRGGNENFAAANYHITMTGNNNAASNLFAINSVTFELGSGINWISGSSISLYGLTRGSGGATVS